MSEPVREPLLSGFLEVKVPVDGVDDENDISSSLWEFSRNIAIVFMLGA